MTKLLLRLNRFENLSLKVSRGRTPAQIEENSRMDGFKPMHYYFRIRNNFTLELFGP